MKGIIFQFHRDLYKYSSGRGGIWKTQDNIIEEILSNGSKYTFKPVNAFSTLIYMSDLCAKYREEIINEEVDDLVLISSFILDFLCIHLMMVMEGWQGSNHSPYLSMSFIIVISINPW